MSIAVIGSVFIDIKGYPDGVFVPEGRNAGQILQIHGGVSRNVAEDIGRAGFSPLMVGLTDTTGTGADVITRLQNNGVDTSHMRCVPHGCGTWLVIFDETGDVAASISSRPDLRPLTDILREEGEQIAARSDALIVELDLEKETLDEVYAIARRYGIPVYALVSNISFVLEQRDRLRETACFVCNLQEAGVFFDSALDSFNKEELCLLLQSRIRREQIPRMVITLGEDGAVYADQDDAGYVPARKVPVADASGAGDAFFSGVVIGLTSGCTLRESCELGTMMAASAITVRGSTVKPEVREEIRTYLTGKGISAASDHGSSESPAAQ